MRSPLVVKKKRSPYKAYYPKVVLLFTLSCIQNFVFALPTDPWLPLAEEGGLTDRSNVTTSNIDQVNISALETASQGNFSPWNTSVTFITHPKFGAGYQFCKIQGACRLGDGTVLVPSWMRAHSKRLQYCGFVNIRYDLGTTNGTPVIDGASGITTKSDFRDADIIGNEAPPGEFSRLAEHLTPSLIILDMLRRPSAYQNTTSRTCVTETAQLCLHEDTGNGFASISPMIFVDSRVSHTKDFMWPKSLLRLIRNSMEGQLKIVDLKDIYGWKIRTQAFCFRSISSTNVRTADIPETAFVPDHMFFSMNGLTREPAEHPRQSASTSPCNIKVLIMNRYGKRFMEGSDVLLSAISSYGRELSKLGHSFTIEAEEVFFEHSSFHEQVSIMQESQVVVATHGEANSNFMFLRPKSEVIEVLPFGFQSTVYQNLSRAYGISYESVRSQPDTEVFTACVKHFNADKGQARDVFIDRWEKVAKEFTEHTIQSGGNVQWNFSAWEDNQSDLKMLRECTLYQRTSVDIGDLARKVVTTATSQCHLSMNLSSLDK